MHFNVAEVVPAVGAAELLVPLGVLCILIVAYGMVLGIDAIVRGFFGTVSGAVGWIPYLGKVLESPVRSIERKIVSFLGGLERDIDKMIGWSWHQLASIATRLWHQLERESELLWQTLKFLSGVPTLHELLHVERRFQHAISRAEAKAEHALEHAISHEERQLRSVAHGVYPRIRSLEHEVGRVIPREIKHTRALAREAEREAERAWDVVRSRPWEAITAASIAAVAVAIERLGLGWIKCNNVGRAGRWLCGLPGELLDLLFATAIAAFALTDICAFAAGVEQVALELEPLLAELVVVENALIGCHGATAPPAFPLPALDLPPNSLGLALAG